MDSPNPIHTGFRIYVWLSARYAERSCIGLDFNISSAARKTLQRNSASQTWFWEEVSSAEVRGAIFY